jgi:N-methylhydantoinase B/oxoprolinase/acetone carboxylase alpha subunit
MTALLFPSDLRCSQCGGDGKCVECDGTGVNAHLNETDPVPKLLGEKRMPQLQRDRIVRQERGT